MCKLFILISVHRPVSICPVAIKIPFPEFTNAIHVPFWVKQILFLMLGRIGHISAGFGN
ncbi:hypothetical protein SMB34_18335 [Thalassospira permensis NBRC 106175]|uniref:Uncharacterized protein n=1 Tax=Thalassospira permensis NBRC 106175 TaxID=1353532 RepID=A0ABR4TN70_9PROT|nr:hypothetical protein SMB34_18335 [Thalassospira permensis NBRC 106175]